MSEISQAIKAQIKSEFMEGNDTELTDGTQLIEAEIIDSLGIFLLVGFIKERFGVEVEPEDITMEKFATVSAITALVEDKTA